MSKHQNNGKCLYCKEIFDKYPGFNQQLRAWFIDFQAKHPEAHISCAGRGYAEQEAKVLANRSEAHYGESAHNWNCAIDLFEMGGDPTNIYETSWFKNVLAPEVPYFLEWYGAPDAKYKELPHVQFREWRRLRAQGLISLVEPMPEENKKVV